MSNSVHQGVGTDLPGGGTQDEGGGVIDERGEAKGSNKGNKKKKKKTQVWQELQGDEASEARWGACMHVCIAIS